MLIGLLDGQSSGLFLLLLQLGRRGTFAVDIQQRPTQVCLVPFFG